MRRWAAATMTAALVLAACGSDDDEPQAADTTTTTTEAAASDPLEGTWEAEAVTCEQQQAALDRAGFTPEQQAANPFGCDFEVAALRFQDGRLVIFLDGDVGWDGAYEWRDDGTFLAGDLTDAGLYITYEYELQGDELVIDMVRNEMPASSEAELLGEKMAQTAIYETAPFTRVA